MIAPSVQTEFETPCPKTPRMALTDVLLRIWERIAQRTTIHGVADIKNAHTRPWRIFWICILAICVGLAGYEISRIFQQYNKKPIITTYETHSLTFTPFPKVSVSLTHMVNMEQVAKLRIAPSVIDAWISRLPMYMGLTVMLPMVLGETINVPTGMARDALLSKNKSEAEAQLSIIASHLPIPVDAGALMAMAEQELLEVFGTTPEDGDLFAEHYKHIQPYVDDKGEFSYDLLMADVGFPINETLRLCYFSKLIDCDAVTKIVYDYRYTVAYLVDVGQPQLLAGMGMMLAVNTHSHKAWQRVPPMDSGIVMQIMDDYSPLGEAYLGMEPGASVQVQLQATHYTMKKYRESGDCLDPDAPLKYMALKYTDTTCRYDCVNELVMRFCGCIPSIDPSILKNQTAHFCKTVQEQLCYANLDMNSSLDCVKECKPNCDYWNYQPSLSYTKMPSPQLKNLLNRQGLSDESVSDYVYLVVGFSELTYMQISQEVSLSFDGFVSQIGGQLGLFLGTSIISLIQMVTFFFPKKVFRSREIGSVRRGTVNNAVVAPNATTGEENGAYARSSFSFSNGI